MLQILTAPLGLIPFATGVIPMFGLSDPLSLPLLPLFGFTALEIVGAPLFVHWLYRVVKSSSA